MATVSRHTTLVMIGRETGGYGVAMTTPEQKFACNMDYSFDYNQVKIPQHTQTLEPMLNESHLGRKSGTVRLSGVLVDEMEIFLEAALLDSDSPYTIQTKSDIAETANNYSFTIYQAYPASSSDAGDGVQAIGCRCQSLTIRKDGEYVGFEAVFKALSIDDMVDFSGLTLTTITNTTYPSHTPFLWRAVTCDLVDSGAIADITDLNFNITNRFANDDVLFQNSQTSQIGTICGVDVKLTYRILYDTVKDATVYDNIWGAKKEDIFSIINASATWAFTTWGQYTPEYAKPDDTECLYESDVTKECRGDSTNAALSIAVS